MTEQAKVKAVLQGDNLTTVKDALQHSSSSIHHPHCSIKKSGRCTCHVNKAHDALAIIMALEEIQAEGE